MTFPAQSPDLRRFPLVAGASRSVVRSPRSAAPRIRFLFVDSRVRFTLRSAYASRRTPCASLRSLRPGSGRTFTSKSSPMPGPPQSRRARPFGRALPVPSELGGLLIPIVDRHRRSPAATPVVHRMHAPCTCRGLTRREILPPWSSYKAADTFPPSMSTSACGRYRPGQRGP